MSAKRFETKNHAEAYKKYRPVYSKDLFLRIIDYVKASPVKAESEKLVEEGQRFDLAVDVGCGSGQSTGGLVEYFKEIIGVDMSEAQIEQAISKNTSGNVQFRVSKAESLPVEDASVDLITVGMALQWFDWPMFYKEVDRTLKPGGVIAAYAHNIWFEIIDHPRAEELTEITTALMRDDPIFKYYHHSFHYLNRKYTDKEMQIPYTDTTRDESLSLYVDGTIEGIFSFLSTVSAVVIFFKENGEAGQAFWRNTITRFCEVYGTTDTSAPVRYKFDMYLLLGRKPLNGQ